MDSKLFNLIKTLDSSEKRYFKIYGSRHVLGSQNKYIDIFDVLDMYEKYDEKLILEDLREKKLSVDFFSGDKYYLYNLILRCLNEYHHDKTYSLKIKDMLKSIEILFHKGLYPECLKLIEKAEHIAQISENYFMMVEILNWKKKCEGYAFGIIKANEANNKLAEHIEKLNNLQQLTNLYYKSYLLRFREEKTQKRKTIEEFVDLLAHPILQSEENATTLPAKVLFYLIFSHYFYVIDEQQQEFEYLQKLIDLIHQSKIYRFENPLDYIAIYVRLLSLKKFINDETFYQDIEILRSFSPNKQIRKDVISMRVFVYTYSNELEYLLLKNRFKEASNKIAEIDAGISKLSVTIEHFYTIYFYYMYAVVLCTVGKYKKALVIINEILNNFSFEDRPQIFVKAEILNIIIHFELENYDYVLLLIKNVNRKYKKDKFYTEFERLLIKKIFAIAEKVPTSYTQISKPLKKFLEMIESTMSDELMRFSNQNYIKWIKAKIVKETVSNFFEK